MPILQLVYGPELPQTSGSNCWTPARRPRVDVGVKQSVQVPSGGRDLRATPPVRGATIRYRNYEHEYLVHEFINTVMYCSRKTGICHLSFAGNMSPYL